MAGSSNTAAFYRAYVEERAADLGPVTFEVRVILSEGFVMRLSVMLTTAFGTVALVLHPLVAPTVPATSIVPARRAYQARKGGPTPRSPCQTARIVTSRSPGT